jgi:multicomponent Na+:H+ antiporter subunit E
VTVSSTGGVKKDGTPPRTWFKPFLSFLLTFLFMFLCWIVLSGKFDPLLLWIGGISSFFVAYNFYDLLFPALGRRYFVIFLKFTAYVPWVIWEIIKANFHLLYLAFHPRLKEMIDPQIITFETHLKSDIAIATLANSITLTPGTITVSANSDGVFTVHAIDSQSADALPGTMLKKVAQIFGETI